MSAGAQPRRQIDRAADSGIVTAISTANGSHHDFAHVDTYSDGGSRLAVESCLQIGNHFIPRQHGTPAAVWSGEPGDHFIADKLVDIASMHLHYLRFNAQHLIQQL